MCCGNCGNKPCGNFTYIRYASDKNGSDFSKTRNAGAIERCFQAIITSPIKLDEQTASFESLFSGLWTDICASCSCGCEFFPYNTPDRITNDGNNTWTFNGSTSPTYSNDAAYANRIFISSLQDGDVMIIPNFTDSDNQPLLSGEEYCFEFNLIRKPNIWTDEYLYLSLGDGAAATEIIIDSNTPLGVQKVVVTAADGAIASAHQLFLQITKSAGGVINGSFEIADFKFGPSDCCSDGDLKDIKVCFDFNVDDFNTPKNANDICEATQTIIFQIPINEIANIEQFECLEIVSILASDPGDLSSIYISNFLGFEEFNYLGESYGNHNFEVDIKIFCETLSFLESFGENEISLCATLRNTGC